MGYARAGFEVVGVDITPQPRYPFEFHRADALEFLAEHGHQFDAVHASPPCQVHSVLKQFAGPQHRDFIPATRRALVKLGKPYVIENVVGAPLLDPVTLCGSMFGLRAAGYQLQRHRLFESNVPLAQPADMCRLDTTPVVGVYGGKVRNRRETGSAKTRSGTTLPLATGQKAMGIDWMNRAELSQAIPPAYTEFVGVQLLSHIA